MSAWENYDDVLQQMQSAGLVFRDHDLPLSIGDYRRVRIEGDREKRGWYKLHELRMDSGDQVLVGTFGVWHGNDPGTQKIELGKRKLSSDQRQALKARLAEDRRRQEAERKRQADRAAARAQRMWQKLGETWTQDDGEEIGSCDYLIRKRVRAHGTRFTPTGALVVPMQDSSERIVGLQFVLSCPQLSGKIKRLGRDKQYWPTGLMKEGAYHLIGSPMASGIVLVAEGYATAASLHEATGLCTAVCFDAGNMRPVAQAIKRRYRTAKLLFCADDDAYGKCPSCRKLTPQPAETCVHCGADTKILKNAGVNAAELAALASDGAWIWPIFADQDARQTAAYERGEKRTDFNDLHALEGLPTVRTQIESAISAQGWDKARAAPQQQGARGDYLTPIQSTEELLDRFALVYGHKSTVFDEQEHMLVSLTDMHEACTHREIHRRWYESPRKKIVRVKNVGFDPACADPRVTCNLWGGWPTEPKKGECGALLDLLVYLCSGEKNAGEVYDWLLKWLAYPIQNPGAKMRTAVIMHGPQGVGKNLFFEAVMLIYGEYGGVIDQDAIEDKFNDWASRKLYMIADEVVARSELFHAKNKLKGYITGENIRINPKNIGSYVEQNHMNIVFLSNEVQPLALERDDRRYAVVWTPPKLDERDYSEVKEEIGNGGIEALHDHLLHVDLSGFDEHSKPPMTRAKRDLIGLSMDSTEEFIEAWISGELGVRLVPVRAEDLYRLYRAYTDAHGHARAAPQRKLLAEIKRRGDFGELRGRYQLGSDKMARFIVHQTCEQPADTSQQKWLAESIERFQLDVDDWREGR